MSDIITVPVDDVCFAPNSGHRILVSVRVGMSHSNLRTVANSFYKNGY
jgi:hypothetical protein